MDEDDRKKEERAELVKEAWNRTQATNELLQEVMKLEQRVGYLEARLNEAMHALAEECAQNRSLQAYLGGELDETRADRIEVFVEVSEDWYGNYLIAADARYPDAKFVRVFLLGYNKGEGWKVGVAGNDDFSMEKEFPWDQRKEAMQLYVDIVTKKSPTKAWLRLKGLENG